MTEDGDKVFVFAVFCLIKDAAVDAREELVTVDDELGDAGSWVLASVLSNCVTHKTKPAPLTFFFAIPGEGSESWASGKRVSKVSHEPQVSG